MSNGLERLFARASGASPGRVAGAVLAALFVLLLPAAADAYTLVLRSGRKVTVPDHFRVTPSAVIYETSPGFFVTVWLANVDAAATEKANAEPAGSFAGRIKREADAEEADAAKTSPAVRAERPAAARVITNKELEPLRLRREAQEAEYERTRRERGMPSRQELQRRFEEQDRRLRELTLQAQAERAEAEAESLRYELDNVRRDLNVLGLRLSRQSGTYVPAYASPSYDPYYNPYYYAPPVQFVNRFPFGRRGGFGRGHFGPHTPERVWPHNPRQGHAFPALVRPTSDWNTPLSLRPLAPTPRP